MSFRTLSILILSSLILMFSMPLHAAPLKSFPVGVVVRKGVLTKIVQLINSRKEAFDLSYCVEDTPEIGTWSIRLQFKVQLQNPDWHNVNSQNLLLTSELKHFQGSGSVYTGCKLLSVEGRSEELVFDETRRFANFKIQKLEGSAPPPLLVWFDPGSFIAKSDYHSIVQVTKSLEVEIERLPILSQAANKEMIKNSVLTWVAELGGRAFGSWLQQQLRGMSYVENLEDLLNSYRGRKESITFEHGPLKMERLLQELRLAFAVYPRTHESLFLNNNGVEFYFNALLLNDDDLDSLEATSSLHRAGTLLFNDRVEALRTWLESGARPAEAEFERPNFPEHSSDFSMFLTEGLVNHTMDRMYRQDLLNFKTTLDMGRSTHGLIAKEIADVRFRLDLGSRKAPQMKFEADRLNLHVADYILSLGTEIEDRIIPATHVLTTVDLSADLTFDTESKKISLVMEPESFSIQLEEMNGRRRRRLEQEDLDLVENVAQTFWQKYFANYPKLTLFRPVFEVENATIRPVDLRVRDGMILMDFSLQTKGEQK